MQVVVVGAGIIGASVAYHLARAGLAVIMLDAGQGAATAQSFGWINGSFYQDAAHHKLRVAGIEAYARLLRALPELPIAMTGALWWEGQGADMDRMQARLGALDYPVQRLSHARLRQLEPDVASLPEEALMFPSEGVAESAALCASLLAQAQSLGARVIRPAKVLGIRTNGGRVCGVDTDRGAVTARHVVVAAGTGAEAILASVGVDLPMLARPGAMVVSAAVNLRIGRVLVTPHGEVRQLPDGRLMSPAAAGHQSDTAEAIHDPLDEIAERTCLRLAQLMGLERLAWSEVGVANRPVPADGLPVIGPAGPEGLTVAVMHSGVTLAAIAGEALADMVTKKASNAHAALLAPYNPERFSAG